MISKSIARSALRFIYCKNSMYINGYTNQLQPMEISTIEHVVPKCYLPSSKKWDLHNLLLIDYELNHSRGNTKLGRQTIEGVSFCPIFPESRGMVARKCAHMISNNSDYIKDNDLIIENKVLEKWMDMYPVTDLEKISNEIIYDIQGDFNKFISE